MKFKARLRSLVCGTVLLACGISAQAALVLSISDGVLADLVITDGVNDTGLGAALPGVITFSVSYGEYEVVGSIGTATSDPLDMHLTAAVTSVGPAITRPLTISLSQTGLSAGGLPSLVGFLAAGGGTGPSAATWSAYADDSDAAFGTGQLIYASTGYNGSGSGAYEMSGLYSATIKAVFDYTGAGGGNQIVSGSVDVDLNVVPEPASIALVGAGLFGLGMVRRQRIRASA